MPYIAVNQAKSPLGTPIIYKGYACCVCGGFYTRLADAHQCEVSHIERCREASKGGGDTIF